MTRLHNVRIDLDFVTGDGCLVVYPCARPQDIRKAFETLAVLGWEELGTDETGDDYEMTPDGAVMVPLGRAIPIKLLTASATVAHAKAS